MITKNEPDQTIYRIFSAAAPLIAACLILALPLRASAAAGSEVEYLDGAVKLKGYFAPADKPKGALLLIPEWWGLNDYAKRRADEYAKLGYSVLAADMYGEGQVTADPAQAKILSGPFYSDPDLMTRRVQKALELLTNQPGVDRSKIAVFGYCFGGTAALQFGLSGGAVRGVAAFHGGLKLKPPANPAAVKARILIMEGEDDPMVPAEDRAAFKKILKEAKLDFTWIDYSGALHAFTNPKADSFNIPGIAYNRSADQQSNQHLQIFLFQVLR